jgi:long-chain acyl-CoA synthetase
VLRDGWFYTGDLGYFDCQGNLFLTGRKKEVIVLSNGKNVYPEEIEAHYLKSPFIKEIAVLGLEGKPGGDRLHAVIVPNFDVLRQRRIVNAKEAIRFDIESLSPQIASTKRIGSYEIWPDDLPRTTTRKIKRFEVEKRVKANLGRRDDDSSDLPAEQPLTADESLWLNRPEVQRALKILRENASTHPRAVRPTMSLELDLGLDSMQRVEALSRLEEELDGNVEESQLAEIYTVRELVDAVLESAASDAGTREKKPTSAGWKNILAEEPTDPDVLALGKPQPFIETFWFLLSRAIQIISLDLFRLRVSGLENLPKKGPYIISSNHQSYIDPALMAGVLPENILRDSFAVGTSEIFGQGIMRRLARLMRVVVLDPDANLVPAMRAGAFGLRHGRVLLLYPEGERSIDGAPKIFKKGAAILSIHLQVPIVPAAIDGAHDVWPRGKGFFQKITPLKMSFGKPIFPPPESEASEAAYENLTAELKARVVAMWEQLRNASDSHGPPAA